MSHRNPMAQMEEMAFSDGELGTYNHSFSLQDKPPGVYIHKDLPSCRGPTPLSTTAAPDTSFIPNTATVLSPNFPNHTGSSSSSSSPIKCSSSLPVLHPPITTLNHSQMPPPPKAPTMKQHDGCPTPSPGGGDGGGAWADPDPPTTTPSVMMPEEGHSPTFPIANPESPPTPFNVRLDPEALPASSSLLGDPVPALPCTLPSCMATDVPDAPPASATPPEPSHSPIGSTYAPPHPPEPPAALVLLLGPTTHARPLTTPEQRTTAVTPSSPDTPSGAQMGDLPSTLSGQAGALGGAAGGSDGPSTPSTNSGETQHSRPAQEGEVRVEDGGPPGDEDAEKNSEDEDDELESDEEELLRVLARLHPVFINISK
ncbi:unnamed protein product [Merluccius merluccius]